MAYRTVDKSKRSGTRARALAPSRSSAGKAASPPDEQTQAQDTEDQLESEPTDAALSPEEVAAEFEDADLRISNSALTVPQPARPLASRGLNMPGWVMANPITRYLAESALELLKVTWPSRRSAWNSTLIVIGMSAVVAIVLGAADFGLNHLVSVIVNLAGPGHVAPTPTPSGLP